LWWTSACPPQPTTSPSAGSYSTFNARDFQNGTLARGTLSPGWYHNFEVSLLDSADPGGETGKVVIRTAGGSRIAFTIQGTTYVADPGVGGTLVYASTPQVYQYRNTQGVGYDFDSQGRLIAVVNHLGRKQILSYNTTTGLLQQVADESGRYLTFGYDEFRRGQFRLQSITDNGGRSVTFGYTAFSNRANDFNLTSVTDVRGQTWTYQYQNTSFPHHVTARLDPRSNVMVSFTYDASGRVSSEANGEGETIVSLTYNADGTTTVRDGTGRSVTHTYNFRHTLTGEQDAAGSASTRYDENFRPEGTQDANGNPTELEWSANGANLETVTDALNQSINFAYDSANHLTLVQDSDGTKTFLLYNTPTYRDPSSGRGHQP
jgi:uncharacterized protein RhaS with RHS repeats